MIKLTNEEKIELWDKYKAKSIELDDNWALRKVDSNGKIYFEDEKDSDKHLELFREMMVLQNEIDDNSINGYLIIYRDKE